MEIKIAYINLVKWLRLTCYKLLELVGSQPPPPLVFEEILLRVRW